MLLCVPRSALRQWMLCAKDEGMTKGDYGFIYINQELPTKSLYDQFTSDNLYTSTTDGKDEDAKQAFQSLLVVRRCRGYHCISSLTFHSLLFLSFLVNPSNVCQYHYISQLASALL